MFSPSLLRCCLHAPLKTNLQFFVFEPFKARILMPGFYFCGAMLRVLDNTDVERL